MPCPNQKHAPPLLSFQLWAEFFSGELRAANEVVSFSAFFGPACAASGGCLWFFYAFFAWNSCCIGNLLNCVARLLNSNDKLFTNSFFPAASAFFICAARISMRRRIASRGNRGRKVFFKLSRFHPGVC